MKVNVDQVRELRKARAWSQDELAMAAGLNLRTIQRIEKEATASLQSVKALASTFGIEVRDLEYEDSEMIEELLGQEVQIILGMSLSSMKGYDTVKGKVVRVEAPWLKIMEKNKPTYININQIKRIIPQ